MHLYSCAITLDLGKCQDPDLRFTFRGRVGLVTALDNDATIPTVMVSFNEGRTSYQFEQQHIKLETTPKSMYGEYFSRCMQKGFYVGTVCLWRCAETFPTK